MKSNFSAISWIMCNNKWTNENLGRFVSNYALNYTFTINLWRSFRAPSCVILERFDVEDKCTFPNWRFHVKQIRDDKEIQIAPVHFSLSPRQFNCVDVLATRYTASRVPDSALKRGAHNVLTTIEIHVPRLTESTLIVLPFSRKRTTIYFHGTRRNCPP